MNQRSISTFDHDEGDRSLDDARKVAPSRSVQIDRWANVVRYHRPAQLAGRLVGRIQSRFDGRRDWSLPRIERPLRETSLNPNRDFRSVAPFDSVEQANFENGRLTLIQLERRVGRPIDWSTAADSSRPYLWRFHLQYHEYLERSALYSREAEPVWNEIDRWIERFEPRRGVECRTAWHPYCISRRLPVWIRLIERFRPDADRLERLKGSIAEQANYLERRLERDIGGNHIWENARTLCLIGAWFAGAEADRRFARARRLLSRCVQEQLFDSGEHFERSPTYQAELAEGLFEISSMVRRLDLPFADELRVAAGRMTRFLDAMRHPDGEIPLFGDSFFSAQADDRPQAIAPESSADRVDSFSTIHQSDLMTVRRVGDYATIDRRDDRGVGKWLFDLGDAAADELPAHGHSDLTGFETSRNGSRLIVDSGTYCYSGPRRNEYRSSAAHNVLTIDGEELADVWGDFRMGRRGKIVDRSIAVAPASTDRSGGAELVAAIVGVEHDAYRRRGVRVQRFWIVFDAIDVWLSIHRMSPIHPSRFGVSLFNRRRNEPTGRFVERVHFHPDVEVETIDERDRRIVAKEVRYRWSPIGAVDRVVDSTTGYSERLYVERRKATLSIHGSIFDRTRIDQAERNVVVGWMMSRIGDSANETIGAAEGPTIGASTSDKDALMKSTAELIDGMTLVGRFVDGSIDRHWRVKLPD